MSKCKIQGIHDVVHMTDYNNARSIQLCIHRCTYLSNNKKSPFQHFFSHVEIKDYLASTMGSKESH